MAYKKCKLCGESILPDSPFIKYKNGWVHENCFAVETKVLLEQKREKIDQSKGQSKVSNGQTKGKSKQSKAKPNAELKSAMSEEEFKDKKLYYDYLKELVEDNHLTPKIYKVSENYIREYGVTFYDLYQTLVYLNEVTEKQLVGDIVGILPFYIFKAQKYFEELDEVDKTAKEVTSADMYKMKVVKVAQKKKRVKQIDITSVGSNKG